MIRMPAPFEHVLVDSTMPPSLVPDNHGIVYGLKGLILMLTVLADQPPVLRRSLVSVMPCAVPVLLVFPSTLASCILTPDMKTKHHIRNTHLSVVVHLCLISKAPSIATGALLNEVLQWLHPVMEHDVLDIQPMVGINPEGR